MISFYLLHILQGGRKAAGARSYLGEVMLSLYYLQLDKRKKKRER